MMASGDFLATYTPLANDIATQTGLDPAVVLGIINNETGGGIHVKGNNIFGISPGGKVAGYPDVETAAQAFVSLMQTPRYRAIGTLGAAQQPAALVRAGYNTVNPDYASSVGNAAASFGKQLGYQGEQQQAAAPDYNNTPSAAPAKAATPDYTNTPAPPAKPAPAAQSEVDKALQSLPGGGGGGDQKPAATSDQSEIDKALQSLPGPKGQRQPAAAPSTGPSLADAIGASAGADAGALVTPEGVGRIIQAAKGGATDVPALPRVPGSLVTAPIYNPLLAIGEGALRLGGAVLRGGQQTVQEMLNPLNPQLARDVAALPEAFPFGPGHLGWPERPPIPGAEFRIPATDQTVPFMHGPAPPSAPPSPRFVQEYYGERTPGQPVTLDDLTNAIRNTPPSTLDRLTAAIQGADQAPAPAAPNALNPDAAARARAAEAAAASATPEAAAEPRPAAAGAEATSEPIPPKSDAQASRDLHKMVEQPAEERASQITKPGNSTPTLVDNTRYVTQVPGGELPPRIMAERDFDPQVAVDHDAAMNEDPAYKAAVDKVQRDRNQGMKDLLDQDAGDQGTLDELIKHRDEVSPDKLKVFDGEQDVDPELAKGLQDRVAALMSGRQAKRGALQSIFKDVADSMKDSDGNLEVKPSQWYGVRLNITDMLKKGKGAGEVADNVRAAKAILEGLLPDIDEVIQSGAPKFETFRKEWTARSQAINAQEFLQQYKATGTRSIYDKDGYLQYNALNRMLKTIAQDRDKPGVQKANSITAEQLQNLENVRNELAAKSLYQRALSTGGSPTVQRLQAAAKAGMGPVGKSFRAAGDVAMHSIGAYAAGKGYPGLNQALALYQSVGRPMREQRKIARRQAEADAQTAALKGRLLSDQPAPTPNLLRPP